MLQRMWLGMQIGVLVAAFLSVVALLIFLIEGPPPENQEITIRQLVVIYGGGGLITGAVAGLLAPATRHWAGAMAIGIIAAIPVAALALLTLYGTAQWTRTDTEVMFIWSILVGGLVGLALWHQTRHYW